MSKMWFVRWGVVGLCLMGASALRAQAGKAAGGEITALMLSDVHFDPFHDPAKAQRLMAAPEGEWSAILGEQTSAGQAEAFAKLQKTCSAKGMDTPYALLRSSLAAMRKEAPEAQFAMISGDLVVHSFDCRFKALLPGKTDADYAEFVEKTVRYTVSQIRLALSGMPVYVALGNNDSGCGDYEMNSSDEFLKMTAAVMVDGLGAPGENVSARASYSASGDMSLTMKAPMRKTRLLVLDDLFQSLKYTDCGKKPNPVAVDSQLEWLTKELAAARKAGEKVWVMGHIPAGVNPYSTFAKMTDVCGGAKPVMFLSSERMAEVMGEYADVIRLGVFGHTHMDEMRLFGKDDGPVGGKVAIKMVSSISPVDGNDPSFTVAKVDPATARLVDYTVFAASNKTGIGTVWTKEYAFGEAYHEAVFSPETVGKVMEEFRADPEAHTDMSRNYLNSYVVGDKSMILKSLWPQYVCALDSHTAKGYAGCVCGAAARERAVKTTTATNPDGLTTNKTKTEPK